MSHYHFHEQIPDLIFIPKSLKEKNIIYPEEPIQVYSSCCLWLFGEIECLLKYDKYSSFKNTFLSLQKGVDFFIDIANLLSNEIEGVECMIKKENDIYDKNENITIDLDRIWTKKGKDYYSIHKNIIYSKFLNIEKLLYNNSNFIYLGEITKLSDCQFNIGCLYEFRSRLDLNFKFKIK